MTSSGMQYKLAQMRLLAPFELPKARLCANVIHAILSEATARDLDEALTELKVHIGRNWSAIQAIQYMSGKQAEFACECGSEDEQPRLKSARLAAVNLCKFGGSLPKDLLNLPARVRRMRNFSPENSTDEEKPAPKAR